MPEYKIEPTVYFLRKYLSKVPSNIANRFYEILEQQIQNPNILAFPANNIKPLRGFVNLWRLRIGDYRLIYRLDSSLLTCINIGKRDSIYNALHYNPQNEQIINLASSLPTYIEYEPTYQPINQQRVSLPFVITSARLTEWGIKEKYHQIIEGVSTEEDVLNLEDKIPYNILEDFFDKLYPASTTEEKQNREETHLQISNLVNFPCPIPECTHIFKKSRGGWDSHVASIQKHPNWHPDVTNRENRKQLFRQQFPDWFGHKIPNEQNTKKQKMYPCPIPGCSKVFLNSRSGWDSHIASIKKHPDWHSNEKNKTERKNIFRTKYPDFFLN